MVVECEVEWDVFGVWAYGRATPPIKIQNDTMLLMIQRLQLIKRLHVQVRKKYFHFYLN